MVCCMESLEVGRPIQGVKKKAEAEALGWREGGPGKSLEGTISRPGGGMGALLGLCLNCRFAGLLLPQGSSLNPQLQQGALSALSEP